MHRDTGLPETASGPGFGPVAVLKVHFTWKSAPASCFVDDNQEAVRRHSESRGLDSSLRSDADAGQSLTL